MEEPQFTLQTDAEDRPVTGMDSMIAALPPALWQRIDAAASPAAELLMSQVMRQMSEQAAAGLGERLHHAQWWVTNDPAVIETIGMVHGCASCRASVDQALAHVAEFPEEDLLVGMLYWAGE